MILFDNSITLGIENINIELKYSNRMTQKCRANNLLGTLLLCGSVFHIRHGGAEYIHSVITDIEPIADTLCRRDHWQAVMDECDLRFRCSREDRADCTIFFLAANASHVDHAAVLRRAGVLDPLLSALFLREIA